MTPTYTLTPLDVAIYLAAHADHEEIGLCFTPTRCLLARTMRAKYPDIKVVEVFDHHMYVHPQGLIVEIPLSIELAAVNYVHDYLTGHEWREPVLKSDFMQAWNGRGKHG